MASHKQKKHPELSFLISQKLFYRSVHMNQAQDNVFCNNNTARCATSLETIIAERLSGRNSLTFLNMTSFYFADNFI
jgi:hypothetical protein